VSIQFIIYGQPATQGSKKQMPIFRNGTPVTANGRTLTRVVEDNPRLPDWRQQVALAAREAYQGELLLGPVELTVYFYQPRPKSHYGKGRNAWKLRPSAQAYPVWKPDTTKLTRAIEDALTGVLWRDDSQVVDHHLHKRYSNEVAGVSGYECHVTIEELPATVEVCDE
jgi:Holliday junction resolvase RusA-like endonuclease